MQATLNYNVAKQVILAEVWPDMTAAKHHRPTIGKFSGTIWFYAWCEPHQRQTTAGFILPSGLFKGAPRNLATLQALAAELGLDLAANVIPPPPPMTKKAPPPKSPRVKKSDPEPKKPLSLKDIMAARKNKQTA